MELKIGISDELKKLIAIILDHSYLLNDWEMKFADGLKGPSLGYISDKRKRIIKQIVGKIRRLTEGTDPNSRFVKPYRMKHRVRMVRGGLCH